MKKGYYFTLDAFFGAALVFIGIALISTYYIEDQDYNQPNFIAEDTIRVFSELKVSELNTLYVQTLIADGRIFDVNKSIIEQAGEFWATGDLDAAQGILQNASTYLLQPGYGSAFYFNEEHIYGDIPADQNTLVAAKKLVSGIASNVTVRGFTSRMVVQSFEAGRNSDFFYIGGFIGEGNLTFRIELPSTISNISAYLEIDPSSDFDLYINSNFSGNFEKGSGGGGLFQSDKWSLGAINSSFFNPGVNNLYFNFSQGFGYISGGYLKVTYNTPNLNETIIKFSQPESYETKWLPGISSLINIFSSIYVPGNVTSASGYLHYESQFPVFLRIGNETIYANNTNGTIQINLTDSDFTNKMSYNDLSLQTIPIRMGVTGTNITGSGGNGDIVLITDLSGSMEWCAQNACVINDYNAKVFCGAWWQWKQTGTYCSFDEEDYSLTPYGNLCSGRWQSACPGGDNRKIDVAINASQNFLNRVLQLNGNRMGMVEYSNDYDVVIPEGSSWSNRFPPFPDGVVGELNLTANAASVQTHIDQMDTWWGTCICCGVTRATTMFADHSSAEKVKAMVVMSDGVANVECPSINTGSASGDAIQAAQDACTDENVIVYTVGFGTDVDEATLQAMVCNNGSYFNASSVDDLVDIYAEIADQFIDVSFVTQVANVTGQYNSTLFADSYLNFTYIPETKAIFGTISVRLESPRFGNTISDGAVTVPQDSELLGFTVTSFSGDSWTDNVSIDDGTGPNQIYDLRIYNTSYSLLGDPFIVNIPVANVAIGSNNVHVSTGIAPDNLSGGSSDNRVIYEIAITASVEYGSSFAKADGCLWNITFEDLSSGIFNIPGTYNGSVQCNYLAGGFSTDDALNDAMYRLLQKLDFDSDGLVDINFNQSKIGLDTLTVSDVPFLWGPSVLEARVWR